MKKKSIHVVKDGKNWAVKEGGKEKAVSNHKTQETAIKNAVNLGKKVKGELRIHGVDGRIRSTRSYGNDPFPPRDND